MVENAGNFSKHGSNIFCSERNVDIAQFFNCKRKALFIDHHGAVVKSVKIWESLNICPLKKFPQLLRDDSDLKLPGCKFYIQSVFRFHDEEARYGGHIA